MDKQIIKDALIAIYEESEKIQTEVSKYNEANTSYIYDLLIELSVIVLKLNEELTD